eukprot:1256686-Prymnesium_polylepis.2
MAVRTSSASRSPTSPTNVSACSGWQLVDGLERGIRRLELRPKLARAGVLGRRIDDHIGRKHKSLPEQLPGHVQRHRAGALELRRVFQRLLGDRLERDRLEVWQPVPHDRLAPLEHLAGEAASHRQRRRLGGPCKPAGTLPRQQFWDAFLGDVVLRQFAKVAGRLELGWARGCKLGPGLAAVLRVGLVDEEEGPPPLEDAQYFILARPRGEVLVGDEEQDRLCPGDPLVEVADVIE